MTPNTHLIVAVDFSPACGRAVREGLRWASTDNCSITAVHVMNEYLVRELERALSVGDNEVRKDWEGKLRDFVESQSGLNGFPKVELRIGSAAEGLVTAVQYHQASTLIMGTSGTHGSNHGVGVVAAQCVRQATADVMLLAPDAPAKFKNILVCIDFSPSSAKALQQALHIAHQDEATVHCVHVYQSLTAAMITDVPLAMPIISDADIVRQARKELDAFVDGHIGQHTDVVVHRLVDDRLNVRDSILQAASNTGADLVVVGVRGQSKIRHFLMGTTAERIVQRSPCSVLVVKPTPVTDSDVS